MERNDVQRVQPALGSQAGDVFEQYLGELSQYSLLSGPEELALARAIEEGEVAHWCALLSSPAALAPVVSVVERHFAKPDALMVLERRLARQPGGATPTDAHFRRAREAAALALRAADTTHAALPEADAEVRSAVAGRRGIKRYLERVDEARRTHVEAKHRLVSANLRLVVTMARRYNQRLMPLSDLVQEGNFGLLRAAERFDYRRGLRFSTYAGWWIRHALNRGLSDRGRLVRVPVHALDDMQRIARASRPIVAQTGRPPELSELAEKTGMAEERLAPLAEGLGRDPVSLDRPLNDDGEVTALDMLPSEEPSAFEQLDARAWRAQAERLLDRLPPLEATILRYRFGFESGEELTLREIGEKYNLSRERIRQLQEQALVRLRMELARDRGRWEQDGTRAA